MNQYHVREILKSIMENFNEGEYDQYVGFKYHVVFNNIHHANIRIIDEGYTLNYNLIGKEGEDDSNPKVYWMNVSVLAAPDFCSWLRLICA